MQITSMKEEAEQLIESLVYVRQTIEAGLAESEAGRTMS